MTRDKEIENKAIEKSAEYRFGQLYSYNNDVYSGFIQGAQWADKNPQSPWISAKDDLPCNHEELIEGVNTKRVIIYTGATVDSNRMNYIKGKWQWFGGRKVTHWMPIPEMPKE